MDRISTFQSFIARSPADPFPRYGLAMEYKSQGRLDEARAAFVELLDGFPDYVPAYLQAGNVLVALGDRAGMVRYGWATLPMDETLVTCAVDFSGRPAFVWKVDALDGKWIGTFDCELAKELFSAFATRAECNLHVVLHYGGNAHHVIECIFKAFARAVDAATRIDPRLGGAVPSTKGTLSS